MNSTVEKKVQANFVEIIGCQFEWVHTGVIKWILDSECQAVSVQENGKVEEILDVINFFEEV
jgi:hypothetical protein